MTGSRMAKSARLAAHEVYKPLDISNGAAHRLRSAVDVGSVAAKHPPASVGVDQDARQRLTDLMRDGRDQQLQICQGVRSPALPMSPGRCRADGVPFDGIGCGPCLSCFGIVVSSAALGRRSVGRCATLTWAVPPGLKIS